MLTPMPLDDITTWRRSQRERLLKVRRNLSSAERATAGRSMLINLSTVLGAQKFRTLGIYWPIQREIDIRPLADVLCGSRQMQVALPVVVQKGEALEYWRWSLGEPTRLGFWIAGCGHIFGFRETDAFGQSLDIIIPEARGARHWQGYTHTMATGQTRYGAGDLLAVPALCKDERRISVEFSIIPFRDESGRMIGMGAVIRDVTKRFEEIKWLRKAATASVAGRPETNPSRSC